MIKINILKNWPKIILTLMVSFLCFHAAHAERATQTDGPEVIIKILLSECGSKAMCYEINELATISRLDSIVQCERPVTYVAKGQILLPNTTFKFNNIQSGTRIVYLKSKDPERRINFWLNATSDRTESFERRLIAQTEGGKQELARLIDLSLMKYGERRDVFKRAARLMGDYFGKNEVFSEKTILNSEQISQPSEQALPLLWK